MHHYFFRSPSEWNIEDFLKNCKDQKTKRAKIGIYITCLNKILNDENEENQRRETAQKLLNKYRTFWGTGDLYARLLFKPLCRLNSGTTGAQGDKTDRKLAKNWELNREPEKIPSFNIYNTFSGGTQTIGTVNDRTFITGSSKRVDHEKDDDNQTKQRKRRDILPNGTKIKKPAPLNLIPSDEDSSDDDDSSQVDDYSSQIDDDFHQADYCDRDDDSDEEGAPTPEESLNSVLSDPKNWILPSGENVCNIITKNTSANAMAIKRKKSLSAVEKAILRYGASRIIDLSAHMKQWFSLEDRRFMMKDHMSLLQVPDLTDEESSFITTIENMLIEKRINEAYEFCVKKFTSSDANSYVRKISKIYLDFIYRSEDGDMLDPAHTEIDIILKACSYIVEGLRKNLVVKQRWGESFCPLSRNTDYKNGRKCDVRFLSPSEVDLGEWEFASNATPQKTIGDRCRSARINQSILNGLLNRNLTNEQVKKINVPFLQIAGTNGQMLIEDSIEGFYVVFPGPKFELPTKLQHIEKLKSSINIIKSVMDIYEQISEIVETKGSTSNALDSIFGSDDLYLSKPAHCKAEFIHEPWWTPKNNKTKVTDNKWQKKI
ncbi:28102_t:CDS:2 [Dentiscutata erythropus]|uniref:28102_t:CDS:1 n=1 Tax=Dentiscutata erythropus TaxID=1348616 RepID=A0A9N9DYN5_9GLOM|nr:28102_t:CDS:2 [Dentiscutata erythropus]